VRIKTRVPASWKSIPESESGMALATTVLLLLVLGLLLSTAVRFAANDVTRTENYYKTREAFYIAEAGLADGLQQFNRDLNGKVPGASANGFDDELDGSSPDWGPLTAVPFAGGAYTVVVTDNDDGDGDPWSDSDNAVILTVTGERRGTRATLEAVVHRGGFVQDHALVTNKALKMTGDFGIAGKQGSAHSNQGLTHEGTSGEVNKGSTANQGCQGKSCPQPDFAADLEPVLEFDPDDFRKYANLILKDNGEIDEMDPTTDPPTLLVTYEKPNGTSCWRPKGGGACKPWDNIDQTGNNSWKISGSGAPQNALIFIETGSNGTRGRLKITGAPSPWTVSIISTGFIDLGGNATILNYRNPAFGKSIQDLLFMTGTDFKADGGVKIGPANTYDPGYIATLDQVDLGGNVEIDGWIHAADQKASPSSDPDGLLDQNMVSGDFKLQYEGGLGSIFPGTVKILSWREVSGVS
jgi:hypothetical protein